MNDYLEKMVQDKVILLQLKDRSELIKKINAKQNGKLLKKADTLNKVLEERGIDYRIKNFATTRYLADQNGNKIKKIYKGAWKVIPF